MSRPKPVAPPFGFYPHERPGSAPTTAPRYVVTTNHSEEKFYGLQAALDHCAHFEACNPRLLDRRSGIYLDPATGKFAQGLNQ